MEISISLDPSVPTNLKQYLSELNKISGISLHCDVMDGEFVPRSAVSKTEYEFITETSMHPVDVHLMVEKPKERINDYLFATLANMKPRSISFHAEALGSEEAGNLIQYIKSNGIEAGLAIDLATDIAKVESDLLSLCDVVLLMSVKAGKSGQAFNPNALLKVEQIKKSNPNTRIIMDGGINADNIMLLKIAGVDTVVVGSAVYNATDREKLIKSLQVF